MNPDLPRRTTGIALALAAAVSLTACGGDGDAAESSDPLNDYLKTEDAKTSSSLAASKSSPPESRSNTATPAASTTGSTTAPSTSAPPPASEPDPLKPTNTAQAAAAKSLVKAYVREFNRSGRTPGSANKLGRYAAPSCKTCRNFRVNIIEWLAKEKKHLSGDLITFTISILENDPQHGVLRVFGTLKQSKTAIVDSKGKTVDHAAAEPPANVHSWWMPAGRL